MPGGLPPNQTYRISGTGHPGDTSYYGDLVTAGGEGLVVLIADSGASSGPGSMALQVAPEDLLAAAESFEAAAIKAQNWLNKNTRDLAVKAAGADVISTNVASWLSDNATGVMGAVPAVQKAAHTLLRVASEMRAAAAAYGVTEGSVATAVAQVGKSA